MNEESPASAAPSQESPAKTACKYDDPFCPCQDGDSCNHVCRNPNHTLVDGSPSPHEIGPSCMAEMSGADKTLTAALARSEAELREMTKNARMLETTIHILRTERTPEIWRCDGCGALYNEHSPLEDCDCKCTSFSFVGSLKVAI
jgi:hypothetical protein